MKQIEKDANQGSANAFTKWRSIVLLIISLSDEISDGCDNFEYKRDKNNDIFHFLSKFGRIWDNDS